jgi:hypothetical protein
MCRATSLLLCQILVLFVRRSTINCHPSILALQNEGKTQIGRARKLLNTKAEQDARRYPLCLRLSHFKPGADSIVIGRTDDLVISAEALAKDASRIEAEFEQ